MPEVKPVIAKGEQDGGELATGYTDDPIVQVRNMLKFMDLEQEIIPSHMKMRHIRALVAALTRQEPKQDGGELVKRIEGLGSLCQTGCNGRCQECPDNVLRDVKSALTRQEPKQDDDENWRDKYHTLYGGIHAALTAAGSETNLPNGDIIEWEDRLAALTRQERGAVMDPKPQRNSQKRSRDVAISEAFRHGYRRAVADAAAIADRRMILCAEAVNRYGKEVPPRRHAEASKRCAQREAQHIRENILQLKPVQDR